MKIISNVFYSLMGMGMPIIFAIPAMGYLSRSIGPEKFSIFLLFFAIIGYSSILDAGLSRALVRFIAIKNDFSEKSIFFSSSMFFVLMISLIPLFLLIFLSDYLTEILKVSEIYKFDFKSSVFYVALSIPFYVLSTMCFSLFEGEGNFRFLNIFKLIFNPLVSFFPAIFVFLVGNSLSCASFGVFISRVIIFFSIFWFAKKYFSIKEIRWRAIIEMLKYSGWITISNTIGPIMMYADRFILSSIYGAKISSYYIAAADFSQRTSIIASAIDKVIFPYLSKENGSDVAWRSALQISLSACILILLPLTLFSPYILEVWLGNDFSRESGVVVQILVASLIFSSLNVLPYSFIQAIGRSDIAAKFHLLQFIPFILLFYYACKVYGPVGAALLVLFRSVFEVIVFFFLAKKIDKIL